jgi:large subunit ribosomal protein L32
LQQYQFNVCALHSAKPPGDHFVSQRWPRLECGPQENSMAVQQNKKSPSKRGMHRAHYALSAPGTAIEPTTGESHLRHHISPNGFYRGRKVLKTKADA